MVEQIGTLKIGDPVKLRDNRLPRIKIRKWEIEGISKETILLRNREKGYTIEVSVEDIEIS